MNSGAQFKYVVDPTSDEPIMLINKHIGYNETDGQGIDGGQFQSELLRLDSMGKKRIQVWINSVGGVVFDGFAIYHAITRSKTKVDTYNVGLAASIAGVIFQAGRKRIMADYSVLMYHNPYIPGSEDVKNDMLDKFSEACNIMTSRSGMSKADVEDMMNKETFLTASEAIQKGLCDEIEQSSDFNKKRLPATVTINNYKQFQAIAASLQKTHKHISMLKVTNALKLTEGSEESVIASAIVSIQDSLSAAQVQAKADKAMIDKMKNDLDEAADKFKKMEDAFKAAKADLDTASDAANTLKATNMVTEIAKIGKIKNDAPTIAKWVARAKVDFDGIKADLEALPLNATAAKLVADVITDPAAAVTAAIAVSPLLNAQMRMIEIANRTAKK
jgi:ATP-dependent protease ClpP protease subunit